MTNKKSTKRALLASVIALMLCVAMLAGTTYAWFADSVVSNNNIIKSGNLDVELYWSTDASKWEKVDATTNVFKEDTLWEPGHTEVVYLKVVNEGSLALKYNLGVNIVSETAGKNAAGEIFKLSNYIEFGAIETNTAFENRDAARAAVVDGRIISSGYSKGSSLTPKDKGVSEEYVALVVYMPETVGNEANYKTGTAEPTINLGINLFATQYTYEEDSYGSDYDKDSLPCDVIATPENINEVLANAQEGDVIGLANVSYYGGVITIPVNNLTLVSNGALVDSIDLNGKDNITIDGLTFDPNYTTIDVSRYDQASASYVDTGYNANITNTTSTPYGADNIVIKNCTFIEGVADWGFDASTYCAIAIEDAGRVSGSTTNLTVENCTFRSNSFEHLRLNYIGGDIVIKNNNFQGATLHHNINASGNKGNWTIIGNSFSNWADGEYAFGTSRNGSDVLTLIIEGNSFTKTMAAGAEIPVLSIKSTYTADNSIVVVENNVANAGAAIIDAAIRSDYKYYMTATSAVYSFASPADAGFAAALAENNATVFLGSGDYGKVPTIGAGATIIGNGETTFATHLDSMSWSVLTNVTFKGVTFWGNSAARNVTVNGTVTFEDCVFNAVANWVHFDQGAGAEDKLIFNNCELIGWVTIGGVVESVEFNGCHFTDNGYLGGLRNYQNATATDCTFDYADGMQGLSPVATLTLVNCENINGTIDAIIDPAAAGTVVK